MSQNADEFDNIPDIYEGIDFDQIPLLSNLNVPSRNDSEARQDESRPRPEGTPTDDLFDSFSENYEDVDWEQIDGLAALPNDATVQSQAPENANAALVDPILHNAPFPDQTTFAREPGTESVDGVDPLVQRSHESDDAIRPPSHEPDGAVAPLSVQERTSAFNPC